MEPTFDQIKSLIVEEKWEGNQLKIKFQASNQTEPIESMGMAMPSPEEIQKRIAIEMAKSTASGMAVNAGANALGNLSGIAGLGGAIGSAVSSAGVGYQMDPTKLMHVDLTEDVRKETALNAFKALSMYYQYENNQWIFKAP